MAVCRKVNWGCSPMAVCRRVNWGCSSVAVCRRSSWGKRTGRDLEPVICWTCFLPGSGHGREYSPGNSKEVKWRGETRVPAR